MMIHNFDRLLLARRPSPAPVADIVQCGYDNHKALRVSNLVEPPTPLAHKLLILLVLWGWLAALDDFRNWLIREAA